MEFLKANGINDPNLMKEMDYQDVLSQQAIFGEELFLFSNKDMQKEVLHSRPVLFDCHFLLFHICNMCGGFTACLTHFYCVSLVLLRC